MEDDKENKQNKRNKEKEADNLGLEKGLEKGEITERSHGISLLAVREKFKAMLWDEEFLRKTVGEKARMMGVSRSTILKWEGEVDWKDLVERYREQYARHAVEIDKALMKKAKGGDVRACELYYQRFEGWNARSGLDVVVRREDMGPEYVDRLIEERKRLLEGGQESGEVQ